MKNCLYQSIYMLVKEKIIAIYIYIYIYIYIVQSRRDIILAAVMKAE